MSYDNGLYVGYFDLRFNTNLRALEYNSGNQTWLQVPVPTGDIALPNGEVLVGNASNVATPVTLSGDVTVSNTGVTTLSAHSVHPSNISNTATDDFVFPRDVTVSRNLIADGSVTFAGVRTYALSQNGSGTFILNDVTGSQNYIQVNGAAGYMVFPTQVQFGSTVLLDKISQLGSGYIDLESQTVIGANAAPLASAVLTIPSTTQGLSIPTMTTTQKNAISSPADGLLVYDTTLHKLCVFSTGTATWQTVTSA